MLIQNLDAFTRALGVENAPAVISFSLLPWESGDQRDDFIHDLTGINFKQANSFGAVDGA